MNTFFSIKDEAECYLYVPTQYEDYLEAKDKGVVKNYSDKEITDMINDFYGRVVVDDSN